MGAPGAACSVTKLYKGQAVRAGNHLRRHRVRGAVLHADDGGFADRPAPGPELLLYLFPAPVRLVPFDRPGKGVRVFVLGLLNGWAERHAVFCVIPKSWCNFMLDVLLIPVESRYAASRCAPPNGSGTMSLITPDSSSWAAVILSAVAASCLGGIIPQSSRAPFGRNDRGNRTLQHHDRVVSPREPVAKVGGVDSTLLALLPPEHGRNLGGTF